MSDRTEITKKTGSDAPAGEEPSGKKPDHTSSGDARNPIRTRDRNPVSAPSADVDGPDTVEKVVKGDGPPEDTHSAGSAGDGEPKQGSPTRNGPHGPGQGSAGEPSSPARRGDRGRDQDKGRRDRDRDRDGGVEKYWVPKTKLGRLVRDKTLTNIEQVLDSGLVLREPEIVDILLGEMQDEVIDVNMVQRMTDSGRRVRFAVTVAVGNENGYLGVGRAHGKEVGPTIRKAIDNAKINIISLKRGCGSWECGCGTPHSIPYKTTGKAGSVEVTFLPAPKGVGLAAGDVAKKILKLGGIRDLWATTRGQTQTTWNYASAVYDALTNLSRMRISRQQQEHVTIRAGGVEE